LNEFGVTIITARNIQLRIEYKYKIPTLGRDHWNLFYHLYTRANNAFIFINLNNWNSLVMLQQKLKRGLPYSYSSLSNKRV